MVKRVAFKVSSWYPFLSLFFLPLWRSLLIWSTGFLSVSFFWLDTNGTEQHIHPMLTFLVNWHLQAEAWLGHRFSFGNILAGDRRYNFCLHIGIHFVYRVISQNVDNLFLIKMWYGKNAFTWPVTWKKLSQFTGQNL